MKIILKVIKGILVGFISIIPGISGSLVAASLGIYEEIIDALSNVVKKPFKSVKSVWEYFLGIVIGIALGVVFIATIFKKFPLQISFLFIGLIIGGIPGLISENKKQIKWKHILTIIISASLMIFLNLLKTPSANVPNDGLDYFKYSIVGFIIAAPIIIPGISGAMVLSTLGYYNSTMDLIKEFLKNLFTFNFSHITDGLLPVVMMGLGAVIGLIIFAKVIKVILNKFPTGFNAVILGILIASPFSILYELNKDLLLVDLSIKQIINTSNLVVSIFFLIFGYLIAKKSALLKDETVKPAEVANVLRATKYMLVDSIIIIISYMIPILVFTLAGHNYNYPELIPSVLTIILIKITFYYFNGLYKVITKHIDYKSLIKIFILIVISNIVIVIILTLPNMPKFMYRSAFLLIASIEIAGFFIYRLGVKTYQTYKELKGKNYSGANTIIIGAGRAGEIALLEVNQNMLLNNNVIGFLDDDSKKLGKKIIGKPVIGNLSDLSSVIEKYEIGEVIFAINNLSKKTYKEILQILNEENIKIKKLNILEDYNEKKFKNINVEDLFDIKEISVDEEITFKVFKDKTILVTGASNCVAKRLILKTLLYEAKEIIILDSSETELIDLTVKIENIKIKNENTIVLGTTSNKDLIDNVFKKHQPNIVIHFEEIRNNNLIENNIKEAIKINLLGTKNITDLSCKYSTEQTIIISSNEAIQPNSFYGYLKKHAEKISLYYNSTAKSNISILRLGNVLDLEGNLLSVLNKQIIQGGPVIIPKNNLETKFITISQAVNLIVFSLINQIGGDIFVYDMKETFNIKDIAERLINLYDYIPNVDIEIEKTNIENNILNYKLNYNNYIKTSLENMYIEKTNIEINNNLKAFEIIEKYQKLTEDKLKDEIKRD